MLSELAEIVHAINNDVADYIHMQLIMMLLIIFTCSTASALVDPNATAETQALYTQLQNASGNYIYFGMELPRHRDNGRLFSPVIERGKSFYDDVFKISGKYAYLYGTDYQWIKSTGTEFIEHHYRNGGIFFTGWHMPNPIYHNPSYPNIGIERTNNIDSMNDGTGDPLGCVTTTCQSKFHAMLDKFADFALNLKDDSGKLIPIIFRPFHEMDRGWYWWSMGLVDKQTGGTGKNQFINFVTDNGDGTIKFRCSNNVWVTQSCVKNAGDKIFVNRTTSGRYDSNQYTILSVSGDTFDVSGTYNGVTTTGIALADRSDEYIAMWRDMVAYLRDIRGVHNLLYTYCPNPNYQPYTNGFPYAKGPYPGDDYIDIMSGDFYDNSNNYVNDVQAFNFTGLMYLYKQMANEATARSKVFGVLEGVRFMGMTDSDSGAWPLATAWTLLENSFNTYSDPIVRNMSFWSTWSNGYGPVIGRLDADDFASFAQTSSLFKFLDYSIHNPNPRKWVGNINGKLGN